MAACRHFQEWTERRKKTETTFSRFEHKMWKFGRKCKFFFIRFFPVFFSSSLFFLLWFFNVLNSLCHKIVDCSLLIIREMKKKSARRVKEPCTLLLCWTLLKSSTFFEERASGTILSKYFPFPRSHPFRTFVTLHTSTPHHTFTQPSKFAECIIRWLCECDLIVHCACICVQCAHCTLLRTCFFLVLPLAVCRLSNGYAALNPFRSIWLDISLQCRSFSIARARIPRVRSLSLSLAHTTALCFHPEEWITDIIFRHFNTYS